MGTSASISSIGELHILPCSVCFMFSHRMHKAWGRGGEISSLELSELVSSHLNEAVAFPPLFYHSTKSMGPVCYQVDKPDSILAQNECATLGSVTGSWKWMQTLALLESWVGIRKKHITLQEHWMEIYSFLAVDYGRGKACKFHWWQNFELGLHSSSHVILRQLKQLLALEHLCPCVCWTCVCHCSSFVFVLSPRWVGLL